MPDQSLPQIEPEVKCEIEWCDEPQFRKSGLCFHHFVEVETVPWDDQDAVRQMCLEGVGYVFGDPVWEVTA